MADKEFKLTVKELADEIGMTVSNLNIQIGRGHAGEVIKTGSGETSEYHLTLDNVNGLLNWIRINGRSRDRKALRMATKKYKEMI